MCVWGGGGYKTGGGGEKVKFYPIDLENDWCTLYLWLPLGKGGGGEIGFSHVEAGSTHFEVVLIWELEVLTIPKGSQKVSTLQKGGGMLKRFTLS